MSSSADDKRPFMTDIASDRPVIAEIRGRRVNEAIERGARRRDSAVFLCECGIFGCSRTIELSLDVYAGVRQSFDRFLIAPGHELTSVDRVVEEHADYFVVVKRSGRPAELAKATDPRGGVDA